MGRLGRMGPIRAGLAESGSVKLFEAMGHMGRMGRMGPDQGRSGQIKPNQTCHPRTRAGLLKLEVG